MASSELPASAAIFAFLFIYQYQPAESHASSMFTEMRCNLLPEGKLFDVCQLLLVLCLFEFPRLTLQACKFGFEAGRTPFGWVAADEVSQLLGSFFVTHCGLDLVYRGVAVMVGIKLCDQCGHAHKTILAETARVFDAFEIGNPLS